MIEGDKMIGVVKQRSDGFVLELLDQNGLVEGEIIVFSVIYRPETLVKEIIMKDQSYRSSEESSEIKKEGEGAFGRPKNSAPTEKEEPQKEVVFPRRRRGRPRTWMSEKEEMHALQCAAQKMSVIEICASLWQKLGAYIQNSTVEEHIKKKFRLCETCKKNPAAEGFFHCKQCLKAYGTIPKLEVAK